MEVKEKRDFDKILVIGLLVVIIILVSGIGFLLVSDQKIPDMSKMFKADDEYVVPLEEFTVNLKSDKTSRNYLKVTMTLMFSNEKDGKVIEASVSKIRDIIISNLRVRTADDFLGNESISKLKEDIVDDINNALTINSIKDVYITDILVQ